MRRGSVRPLLPLLGAAVAALPAVGAFPAAARAASASPPAGYVALDSYASGVGASVRYNPDTQQSFVVWSGHVWVAYPIATANLPGETSADAVLVGGRLFLPETLLQTDMPPAPAPPAAAGAPVAPQAGPSAAVARLIAILRGALGDPYVWGGTTPSGFDCSGLIQWAFAQVGVELPRTSFAQFDTGTPAAQPAPGDLVFFQTYAPGASHVGMAIGAGQFIDVGQTVVQIDDLAAPYWAQRYLGARSVLPA